MSLATYSVSGYADAQVADYETDAKRSGANYVALSNVSYVDLNSGVIHDAYSGSSDQTAPLSDVDGAIKTAEAQGLSVLLKPQIVTNDPTFAQYTSGSWINLVNPDLKIADPATFFANYKTYILKWAALAESDHVAALSIGNEMVAATKPEYTAYWNDIISAVRQVYHGELTYSALLPLMTNATTNEVQQIGFWNKLDFAGFDVYPSLSKGADPSVSSLDAAWHGASVFGNQQDYYAFVADMAARTGKPVVFTETGLPSFAGASDRETSSDGTIGSTSNNTLAARTDVSEQANWWQSFFQTWAVDTPAWLQGVFVYNNDPEQLGSYAEQNYNVIGKPAAQVISAWFGGGTYLAAGSDRLAGSQADDQLYAYGPATGGSSNSKSALSATQYTTVSVTLTAAILDGTAPTLDVIINGHDFGAVALKPADSGYVNSDGVHFTTNQTYTFSLPGLQAVTQLEIDFTSPSQVGGRMSNTFYQAVSVNGVALTSDVYTTSSGHQEQQKLPDSTQAGGSSQWDGGSSRFDATPWNQALSAATAVGGASDPIIVTGGGGADTLHVLGNPSQYRLNWTGADSFTLAESAGLGQNLIATGVSTVEFADGSVRTSSSPASTATAAGGAPVPDGASSTPATSVTTPSPATSTPAASAGGQTTSSSPGGGAGRSGLTPAPDVAPLLGGLQGSAAALPDVAVVLQPALILTDPDPGAAVRSAQVAIASGFSVGDRLAADSVPVGVTASFDATTGVLTLNGFGSDADYQAALRSVAFTHDGVATPAMRTVTFSVVDEQGVRSVVASEAVSLSAPASPASPAEAAGYDAQIANLLRSAPASADPSGAIAVQVQAGEAVAADLDAGRVTPQDAQNTLFHLVDGTTSVAEISYAFFTGRTPTAAGLDYLVHSDANPTDLNDAYYAKFTVENRYINFGVNLATGQGAGAAAFQAAYGSLSLADAAAKAYQAVFGVAPAEGKIDAILGAQVSDGRGGSESRAQYFADVTDGSALAQKAAVVGFLLADSVKEGFGAYQQADLHFLQDLAHGTASFDVDLLNAYTHAPTLAGQAVVDPMLGS